jgi:hypothetical protein
VTDAAHNHEPPWIASIAAMAGLWLLLAAWSMHSDRLGCLAGGSLVLVLGLAILSAGAEARLLRRHAFARAYLARRGLLSRWLSRYTLLTLWLGIRALALALLLVATLPLLGPVQWLILLGDVLVFAAVVRALRLLLRSEVRGGYLGPLAHAWAHRVNALLVWIALVVSLMFGERADLATVGVIDAVRHGAASVELGCDVLAVLARAAAAGESALWWAAQQLFAGLEDPTRRLFAWAGFIAVFGASFVFAWAWSRALGGLLARPWRLTVGQAPIGAGQDE